MYCKNCCGKCYGHDTHIQSEDLEKLKKGPYGDTYDKDYFLQLGPDRVYVNKLDVDMLCNLVSIIKRRAGD